MKNLTLIFFLSLFIFSCSENQDSTVDEKEQVTEDTTSQEKPREDVIVLKDVPIYKGLVTDHAGLFSEDENAELVKICEEVSEKIGYQVLVLSVMDMSGETIDPFALKVARAWGAAEGVDAMNGILLVISVGNGQLKFHVGDVVRENIDENQFQGIIQTHIAPNFPQGQYYSGVSGALKALEGVIQ